jgi:hypothetical protein
VRTLSTFLLLIIPLITVILSLGLLQACSDDVTGVSNTDFKASEPFSFRVDRGSRSRFLLEGVSGTVLIEGAAGADSILITGEKVVESDSKEDAETYLEEIDVRLSTTDSAVSVETLQPADTKGRKVNVNYTVSIPEDFQVAVASASAAIAVRSIKNRVGVSCASCRVVAKEIVGSVGISVASGVIDAAVTLPLDGVIDLDVASGTIALVIPQDTSAMFWALVAAGTVTVTDLTLTDRVQDRGKVTGKLGDGQGTITLDVGSGTIQVTGVE